MTPRFRPKFRPGLLELERRDVPAWFSVAAPDPAAGTMGDAAAVHTGQLLLNPAYASVDGRVTVAAASATEAVKLALAGTITVDFAGQSMAYAYGPDAVGTSFDEHKPFVVQDASLASGGGASSGAESGPLLSEGVSVMTGAGTSVNLLFEDLAGRPECDYDYNDHGWYGISVREVPPVATFTPLVADTLDHADDHTAVGVPVDVGYNVSGAAPYSQGAVTFSVTSGSGQIVGQTTVSFTADAAGNAYVGTQATSTEVADFVMSGVVSTTETQLSLAPMTVTVTAEAVLIKSVTWENTGTAAGGPLDDQPAGTPGGGQRIYAEKMKYKDDAVANKVLVKIELTVKKAGEKVSGYVFDVDDPSSNKAPVDDETKALDNRDAGSVGPFSGTTDENGVVTVVVTAAPRPGDNYRTVATIDAIDVATAVKVKQDDADRAGVYYAANNGQVANANDKTVRSGLLTVWRHLHVERDHMGKPGDSEKGKFLGAGQGTGEEGTDDVAPDGPNGEVPDPSIDWMQTIYRKAYIEVVDDVSDLNKIKVIPFIHNFRLDGLSNYNNNITSIVMNAQDLVTSEGFWVIQLVGAYEPLELVDNDPHTPAGDVPFQGKEQLLGEMLKKPAKTPESRGFPAMVYTEVVRDYAEEKKDVPGAASKATLMARIAAHESLHPFGMPHEPQAPQALWGTAADPYTVGILRFDDNNWKRGDDANMLEPAHIARLRLSRPGGGL